jgi:nicotinic acid phosphoribosyltransferase
VAKVSQIVAIDRAVPSDRIGHLDDDLISVILSGVDGVLGLRIWVGESIATAPHSCSDSMLRVSTWLESALRSALRAWCRHAGRTVEVRQLTVDRDKVLLEP